MKYVVVGTAGHIDHGKSALVRALTGTDPDRLEEEKRRGITIDLGFAHLDLGDGLRVAFIDVPGHERFVKNMLAGVGGIDLVLLVVAADESIKPQTLEHFEICKLLGVRNGLVVITKSDLAEPEMVELVKLEVQELVAGSFLEGAPMLALSAKTGAGLDALKTELRRLSFAISPKPADLPYRLPIDRAFVIKGFGAVVTGTLVAGIIEKDVEAELYPLGRRARVRGIEVHNAPAEQAVAGQRTALNLAGVEAGEIARGTVLAPPGLFRATSRLDCSVKLLPSARPLKNRTKVHFHSGTAECVAEAVLLDAKELKPGAKAFVQLRLAEEGLFLPGDRFIIRQFSPVTTVGGGVVLDGMAPRRRLGDPAVERFLNALENGDAAQRLELFAGEEGEAPIASLAARLGWSHEELLRLGKALESGGKVRILGQPPNVLVHSRNFHEAADRLIDELENFHASNPLVSGISKEELRVRPALGISRGRSISLTLFNAVIQELVAQEKIEVREETVRLAGRSVQLSPEEAAARKQIAQAFEAAGLAVPSAPEVLAGLKIDRTRAGKILQILLKEKTLVRIAEGLIFHRAALEGLRATLAQRKAKNNRINVTSFKELTGLSRKYAIPLLEYLDRERVTRREGDERIIL